MMDEVAKTAAASVGQALGAGAEGAASWLLAAALNPVGLIVMVGALIVALWKSRG